MQPSDIFATIWAQAGMPETALGALRLTGGEPALPSSFRVGAAAQVSIAASALAAAEIWRLRGGEDQQVAVDMAHAAAEFRSERHLRVDGGPTPELWDKIAGIYQAGDGRWLRLHTNFPHHRDGVLDLLDCANDRDSVQTALAGWEAEAFETAAAERGLVVAMMRSPEEWAGHPQAQALDTLPLIEITRIGPGPVWQPAYADRPLAGVRVLDLTRIIAGPVCGRTLAAHGADVLRVTGPKLPFMAPLVMDGGRGKLSAHLDLATDDGRDRLQGLLSEADLFVQGYRPGTIADRGFSPAQAAALRPGIVYVSLSAYGRAGPWSGRRGFDSLVQTASGINHAEAKAASCDRPRALPCQALDHASGQLMAFGALAALARRVREGGSWHVQVSLARTGRWLMGLGRLENGLSAPDQDDAAVAAFLEESPSGFGHLTAIRHAARLSATPPRWDRPAMPLGSHAPAWPEAA